MRRANSTSHSFGPGAHMAFQAVVRLRRSYLLGRWAQAPISHPAREADT